MTKIVRTALMSLGIVATLAGALMATSAHADQRYYDPNYGQTYYGHQPYYPPSYAAPRVAYPAPVLNDRQIERRLHRQGFNGIGELHRANGLVYTRAVDNWGRHVRVTASAITGQVVDTRYRW